VNFSLLLAANVASEENVGTFGGNKFALLVRIGFVALIN